MSSLVQLNGALAPNSTIGIVGGGQLGRMLAVAAAKLGFRTIVLEPGKDCPASQVCNDQIVAAYDDEAALQELARVCDVITYEFENVPLSAADLLDKRKPLYPPARALAVAQDRIAEKTFLQGCGVEVAPFVAIKNLDDLRAGLGKFGKGVLKTRRFGYDGKGQHVFRACDTMDDERLEKVLSDLGTGGGFGYVLEDLIDFVSEFSIIGARGLDGRVECYDPASNIHENGILRRSVVPANFETATVRETARQRVANVLEQLDYVGVIGVEFFQLESGLMVNEIAPRVHNTGHWTVEACATCQFEQHIRAITGLPLGDPRLLVETCEMDNLLGDEVNGIAALLADNSAHVTLYGKAEARSGRKMGHVTRLGAHKGKKAGF
ncbi:MAG: 5-(carboxyamino)imidazole ribonucleotide synthase [Rhizobiaceae bacterium]